MGSRVGDESDVGHLGEHLAAEVRVGNPLLVRVRVRVRVRVEDG